MIEKSVKIVNCRYDTVIYNEMEILAAQFAIVVSPSAS